MHISVIKNLECHQLLPQNVLKLHVLQWLLNVDIIVSKYCVHRAFFNLNDHFETSSVNSSYEIKNK